MDGLRKSTGEKTLVVKHAGLTIEFNNDSTYVEWDHLGEERGITSIEVGEAAIQMLIQYALLASSTPAELEQCMVDIRSFYGNYLVDKSALNTLAFQIKMLTGSRNF